jgi:hypothetical protein
MNVVILRKSPPSIRDEKGQKRNYDELGGR